LGSCFNLRLGYFLDYLKKLKCVDFYVNDISCYLTVDIIIIQKEAALTPGLIRQMMDNPKPVIYETDDFLQQLPLHTHCRSVRSSVAAKQRLLGSWNAAFIASTSYLANKLRIYGEDVSVIHNAPPLIFDATAEAANPLLACFMGTASHSRDFAVMGDALSRVVKKHPKVRYLFMGDTPPGSLREKIPFEYYPFNIDYHAAMDRFHSCKPAIGLAPLLDSQWNRAKSVIKYIDYTYAGTVGVYSDIIPYREIKGGLLVKNHPDQWFEGICRLIEDPKLRLQLHKKAVDDIKARFLFNVEAERFADILERVAVTKPLLSETRKKEALHLTRMAKDSGQTAEFLEYVRLFYPVYLKNHITVQDILKTIAKIDRKSFSINLITDVMEAIGETEKLNALQKSWTDDFITRPYSGIKNTKLEMYRFASRMKTSGAFTKALPIFERIFQKNLKDKIHTGTTFHQTEIHTGAAFHLGEMALTAGNYSKAEKFFAECLALNPEHSKARGYLEKITNIDKK
jgi:glycosyltransferase involved in cell wall biosynthesis